MRAPRIVRRTAVALGFALSLGLLPMAASAGGCGNIGGSGYEIFPGLKLGTTTVGTTFVGWTTAHVPATTPPSCPPMAWLPPPGDGGLWAASINYTGTAGTQVIVVGGSWALRQPDGSFLAGKITGGQIDWSAAANPPCQPGEASVSLGVSVTKSFPPSPVTQGGLDGCLNDTSAFPPTVWFDLGFA